MMTMIFIFLQQGGWGSLGAINQECIDFLTKNNPGIFDGVDKKTVDDIMDDGTGIQYLFDSDPVKYQPIARYIEQGHDGCLSVCITKYGEYKGGFYTVEEDYEGTQELIVHSEQYDVSQENKRFFTQLREFLFDESVSSDDKVGGLQMLFCPINQGEADVSIDDLRENMDFLSGTVFKQAQQRAINSGMKP